MSAAPKPLRITFALPGLTYSGGGFRTVMVLAKGLQERGHTVKLVAAKVARPTRLGRIADRLGLPRASYKRSKKLFAEEGLRVEFGAMPARPHEFPDADLLVVTWYWALNWVHPLPASKGLQVHYVQGNDLGVLGERWLNDARAAFALPKARIVVAEWLQRLCMEEHGAKDAPVVVANGIDETFLTDTPRTKPERPTLGAIWTAHDVKAPDVIGEVLQRTKEALPNLRAVVFGLIDKGDLPDWVDYHQAPERDTIRSLYGQCNAWLWPSREEGFGLPILEAMAQGTPVVATAAGAAPELVPPGGGAVVPVDDVDALTTQCLRYLQMPPTTWATHSHAARTEAGNHPWSRTVLDFERALIHLLPDSVQK